VHLMRIEHKYLRFGKNEIFEASNAYESEKENLELLQGQV